MRRKKLHEDDHVFGKWAWPSNRNFRDKNPPGEAEDDTPEETSAYDALAGLVDANVGIEGWDARNILAALRSGQYSDVLKPPYVPAIYRGMSVPKGWLARALRDIDRDPPDSGEARNSFTFDPNSGESSSWTTSETMADEYANRKHGSGYGIVMTAPVDPQSMICGPGGFYKVRGLDEFPDEDEVICFGPVRVTHLRWNKLP